MMGPNASDEVSIELPNTQNAAIDSEARHRGVRKLDRNLRAFARNSDSLHSKIDNPARKIVPFTVRSYGEITFTSNKQKAQFVVVANTARQSMEQAAAFLYSGRFGLDKPEFLISITGGAGNLDEFDERRKSQLQQLFTRAIAKTAVDTNALIVTGGMRAGVMEYAGRAVSDLGSKTDLLGICVLKKFVGFEKFVTANGENADAEVFREVLYDDTDIFNKLKAKPQDGLSVLDANHSKFIMIDGDNWGDEIGFRLELEAHLASVVPAVSIVVNGGPNTAKTVLAAVRNGCPIIVMKNSGRFADILAKEYEMKYPSTSALAAAATSTATHAHPQLLLPHFHMSRSSSAPSNTARPSSPESPRRFDFLRKSSAMRLNLSEVSSPPPPTSSSTAAPPPTGAASDVPPVLIHGWADGDFFVVSVRTVDDRTLPNPNQSVVMSYTPVSIPIVGGGGGEYGTVAGRLPPIMVGPSNPQPTTATVRIKDGEAAFGIVRCGRCGAWKAVSRDEAEQVRDNPDKEVKCPDQENCSNNRMAVVVGGGPYLARHAKYFKVEYNEFFVTNRMDSADVLSGGDAGEGLRMELQLKGDLHAALAEIVTEGTLSIQDLAAQELKVQALQNFIVSAIQLSDQRVNSDRSFGGAAIEQEQLRLAWERFALYDYHAMMLKIHHTRILFLTYFLTIAMTTLSVVFGYLEACSDRGADLTPEWAKRLIFVAVLVFALLAGVMTAAQHRFNFGEKWLMLRASSEQVLREIYVYRTGQARSRNGKRGHQSLWLSRQLARIANQLKDSEVTETALYSTIHDDAHRDAPGDAINIIRSLKRRADEVTPIGVPATQGESSRTPVPERNGWTPQEEGVAVVEVPPENARIVYIRGTEVEDPESRSWVLKQLRRRLDGEEFILRYNSLVADQYVRFRLERALSHYSQKTPSNVRLIKVLHAFIYTLSAAGAFLAAVEQAWWIPISACLGSTFLSYLETSQVQFSVVRSNRASMELDNVRMWWRSLNPVEKASPENIASLVATTESIMDATVGSWFAQMHAAQEKLKEAKDSVERNRRKKKGDGGEEGNADDDSDEYVGEDGADEL